MEGGTRSRRIRPGRRRGTLGVVFSLLVVLATFMFLNSSYFHVTHAEIQGLRAVDEQEVLDWAGLAGSVNIWRVDTRTVARNLEAHPRVLGAEVVRRWPNSLTIRIMERDAAAFVPYHDLWLAVDGAGVGFALESAPVAGTVILEGLILSDHRLGDMLPAEWNRAVRCAAYVRQYGMDWVRRIQVGAGGDLVLVLERGLPARLGTAADDLQGQLAVLNHLWQDWQGQLEQVSYFDVRNPGNPAVKLREAEPDD